MESQSVWIPTGGRGFEIALTHRSASPSGDGIQGPVRTRVRGVGVRETGESTNRFVDESINRLIEESIREGGDHTPMGPRGIRGGSEGRSHLRAAMRPWTASVGNVEVWVLGRLFSVCPDGA